MLLEKTIGSIANKIPKFLRRNRLAKDRTKQHEKRQKREGLLSEVFTPEDRILLSGITISDDTIVVEH